MSRFRQCLNVLWAWTPTRTSNFACLAALHKARLKYERILETQPVPTIDQVGPRGLLQFGGMDVRALAGFLLWRKWVFDIDNRAGQETGYLFEPIIAAAVGGVPVSARKSPVRRRNAPSKGRQVDCLREKRAYEIKLRVTIGGLRPRPVARGTGVSGGLSKQRVRSCPRRAGSDAEREAG